MPSVGEFSSGSAQVQDKSSPDISTKDSMVPILLIEDDAPFVYLLKRALDAEQFRYDMTVLADGVKAMAFIRKGSRFGRRHPALIVMDLHLPKADGMELLKEIRRSAAFSDVLVAVLTSSVSPQEKNRIARFQGTCFIAKPDDLDEFSNVARRIKEMALAAKASGGSRAVHQRPGT